MIYLQILVSASPSERPQPATKTLLENAALATLHFTETPPDVDISIVLTNDAQLQKLNLEFLGIDAPTDVLAFPSVETDPDSGHQYLGDVIISYSRAEAQAAAVGHPIESELRLLVIHGVLHLLGYDHAEEQEKAVMWSVQEEILVQIRDPEEKNNTVNNP